jgi:hypothetical protein
MRESRPDPGRPAAGPFRRIGLISEGPGSPAFGRLPVPYGYATLYVFK